jgi:hypothetical protein
MRRLYTFTLGLGTLIVAEAVGFTVGRVFGLSVPLALGVGLLIDAILVALAIGVYLAGMVVAESIERWLTAPTVEFTLDYFDPPGMIRVAASELDYFEQTHLFGVPISKWLLDAVRENISSELPDFATLFGLDRGPLYVPEAVARPRPADTGDVE